MADYAAQATQIYDPQMAAEQSALDQKLAGENASLDTDTRDTGNAYTTALQNAAKTEQNNTAREDHIAQTHGLWTSGLAANAQRIVGEGYGHDVNNIETLRANKLADIASRRQLATSGYNTEKGALTSKYSGLKSKYVIDSQNEEARAEAANQAKIQAAQIRASRGPSASASRTSAGYGYDDIANLIAQEAGKGTGWGDAAKKLADAGYDPSTFDQVFKNVYGQQKGDATKFGYNAALAAQEKRAYQARSG